MVTNLSCFNGLFNKKIIFCILGREEFRYKSSRGRPLPRLISAIQARKYLVGRAQGYLVSLIGTEGGAKKLETKPAVMEFSDVFLEELSGLTPEWEIEFEIEVLPRQPQYQRQHTGCLQQN